MQRESAQEKQSVQRGAKSMEGFRAFSCKPLGALAIKVRISFPGAPEGPQSSLAQLEAGARLLCAARSAPDAAGRTARAGSDSAVAGTSGSVGSPPGKRAGSTREPGGWAPGSRDGAGVEEGEAPNSACRGTAGKAPGGQRGTAEAAGRGMRPTFPARLAPERPLSL